MPRPNTHRAFASVAAWGVVVSSSALARADIPVGYKGTPFDPAVAGGPKLPPGTQGGPYAIPGRLDFVNYDLGGDGVGYHVSEHAQRGGAGYRIDVPTATLSLTSDCISNGGGPACQNVWYDTSPTLDGTIYPTPTTADFNIGAVHTGDWFNFTVNVGTTGTYSLSSTWATGSGPPGGEGGNGDIGLSVFSNNTKLATWTAVFPNFDTTADYHHWRAYPNFATVTLTAGPQVIELLSEATALQLDYVQFSLVTDDGGLAASGSAVSDASALSGSTAGGSSGSAGGGATGALGGSGSTSGSLSSSGAVSTSGMTSTPSGSTSSTGTGNGAPAATSGAAAPSSGSGANAPTGREGNTASGCALAARPQTHGLAFGFALIAASLARRRKRCRRPR